MLPTLVPDTRVLVIRHCPLQLLHKGNIVLIRNGISPQEIGSTNSIGKTHFSEYLLVKRITHLPGDDFATEWDGDARTLQLGTSNGKISRGYIFVSSDNPSYQTTTWGLLSSNNIAGVVIKIL